MIKITKIVHFEMAHAIYGYNGRCKNIHGHSYELHVTVTGRDTKGIIKFTNAKNEVISAVSIEIDDVAYMVKVSTQLQKMVDNVDIDDDFDPLGDVALDDLGVGLKDVEDELEDDDDMADDGSDSFDEALDGDDDDDDDDDDE